MTNIKLGSYFISCYHLVQITWQNTLVTLDKSEKKSVQLITATQSRKEYLVLTGERKICFLVVNCISKLEWYVCTFSKKLDYKFVFKPCVWKSIIEYSMTTSNHLLPTLDNRRPSKSRLLISFYNFSCTSFLLIKIYVRDRTNIIRRAY